jgi:lysophospholipase L1-like esterase
MTQILVYGDSLTWGIIPDTRRRLPFESRWPGVVERDLTEAGHSVRVIEDCLNGTSRDGTGSPASGSASRSTRRSRS